MHVKEFIVISQDHNGIFDELVAKNDSFRVSLKFSQSVFIFSGMNDW